MPLPKPKKGERVPGSGRKPGVPNKATQDLMAICAEEGVDPFRGLCRLSKSGDTQVEMAAYKELCQYLYPKRKALEHSTDMDPAIIEAFKAMSTMSEDELRKIIADELRKSK